MRATMRITWPLLSLCFLLHGPCSNADTATAPSVIKIDASSQPGPALSSNAVSNPPAAAVTSVDVSTVKVATMAPTPANQPPAATRLNPGVTAVAITQPNKPITNNQQPTTVTNKPTQPTTVNPGAVSTLRNDAKTAVVNTIKPASTPQAAPAPTTDSSNTFVATTDAAAQTAGAGGQTSGTQRPVSHGNPGTTKITNILTDAPTTGHQPDTHFTFTTKTSQDSKGGTQGTTVMTTSSHQTAAKTQGPAGNPTTTLNPSTPTKTGTPAAVSFATKAAATSPQPTTTTTPTAPTTAARPKMFLYSLNTGQEKEEEKDLVEVCRRLMVSLQDGNCTLIWKHHNGKIQFESVEINGKVKTGLAAQYYEEITRKPTDNKTLIAILASCGALLIMIVILAVCASHHRKPYHENQQHLTEELHTVENGYHDNPTLEVMEVQPEMQEKKKALNGEFNDSWIVPIDNLLKEDIADEEDTHL